jgi:integral membrane protein
MKVPVNRLRVIGIYEGISYLVLLFIAMPLKYFADLPKAVTYVGWAHGLLFVMFMIALTHVWFSVRWKFKNVVLAFVAALLPFGTFYLDKRLREEDYN